MYGNSGAGSASYPEAKDARMYVGSGQGSAGPPATPSVSRALEALKEINKRAFSSLGSADSLAARFCGGMAKAGTPSTINGPSPVSLVDDLTQEIQQTNALFMEYDQLFQRLASRID